MLTSAGLAQLAPEHPADIELSSAGAHYAVKSEAGRYVRIAGFCADTVLELTLRDGRGQQIAKASSIGGSGGTAEIAAVQDSAETLDLEARLMRKDTKSYRCRISIAVDRPAGERDRAIAALFRAWSDAQDLSKTPAGKATAPAAYERSLEQAVAAGEGGLALAISVSLGQFFGINGQYAQTVAAEQRGLELERRFVNPRARAQMLYYDAVTRLQMEDARAAIPIFNSAMVLVRELGQAYEESLMLHNLSVAHWELGDCATALDEGQQALAMRRRSGDREREGYSLLAVAKDYLCLGNSQRALDTYADALSLWRDLKNARNEAAVLNDQGVIYASLGQWDQAEALHRNALAMREKIHDNMGLVESEYNLGDLKVAVHSFQAALPHMERALKLARATQFRRGEGFALRGLGQAHLRTGDLTKPPSELADSIRVLQEVGDRSGEAWSWQALAEYHVARGDSPEARRNLEQALSLEREIGDRMAQSVALVALARLLRTAREFAPALAAVDEAISLIEESRSSLLAPTVRVDFLASKRDAYALRIELLREGASPFARVARRSGGVSRGRPGRRGPGSRLPAGASR
jgi:tetratricopeptide (TPR) repeat protein